MPPGTEAKIIHAEMTVAGSVVNLSDGHCAGAPRFEGFSLTLPVADEAAASRAFTALAEGGQVRMPLGKTFFAPCFGMVSDRFGVLWMVIVPASGGREAETAGPTLRHESDRQDRAGGCLQGWA